MSSLKRVYKRLEPSKFKESKKTLKFFDVKAKMRLIQRRQFFLQIFYKLRYPAGTVIVVTIADESVIRVIR